MSQPRPDPELTAVERALAGLAPSAAALDRDALMFAAGRASARRGWGWPCATAGAALTAAALAALLLLRPAPDPVVRYVPSPPREAEPPPRPPDDSLAPEEAPPPAPRASPPRADYLTLRHEAERWGDAGPPAAPFATAGPKPAAAADALGLPPDVRSDPWIQRRTTLLTPGGPL